MRPAPRLLLLSGTFATVVACQMNSSPSTSAVPPRAAQKPFVVEAHGHERLDEYYWLRDREDPEVIAYLEAENEYTKAKLAHTEALQEELFEEIKGRIKQDDSTVPVQDGGYWYYRRFEDGKQYPIHCRRVGGPEGEEQVLLDVNEMAEGHEYFAASGLERSHDHSLLAFGVDTQGRRIYTVQFKDLRTGELLPDTIPDVTSNLVWANDDRTLFYARQDPDTLRSYQIYRHELGTDPADDVLVYQEDDEEFYVSVDKTRSEEWLIIHSGQTVSDEVRVLRADDPTGEWRVVQPRQRDLEYSVDHAGEHFYVLTNHEATNFRLMRAPVDQPGLEHWEEVIAHRDDVLLEDVDPFRDFLVVSERVEGLMRLAVRPWDGGEPHFVRFDEPAYDCYVGTNPEFGATKLRLGYSSMKTPGSVYDWDMRARSLELLKRDEVLGGYDPDDYVTERLWATVRDGVRVPVSLVRRADAGDGPHPLLLYAYGSYGSSMDASFSAARMSLVDRGFVYAIAHVRGGEEMGRHWYDTGKLLHKKNTFTDFIDCGKHLAASGYTEPAQLFAMGGSAGGLLMGAIVNMEPALFRGVVAAVPFVDVVTTMLDESIPLTTFEYDEWGNPNQREYYDYMLSYSPYDNVEAKDYPHLLVTTGLHDSQVQYWEPAKWVARLRERKTDDHLLLLKTEMHAGHGGASGRYRRYEEVALKYAFLIDLAGTGS